MIANIESDIRELENYIGFPIARKEITLESKEPYDETFSYGLCQRFYGKEKELRVAIKKTTDILVKLKSQNNIDKKKIALFFSLLGDMYYIAGDFNRSINCFRRSLSYNKDDMANLVGFMFSLRANGNIELFEDIIFNFGNNFEMEKFPFVSVVVPTYNRKEILNLTISALLQQDYPKDKYEIIIVDDGSNDGTEKLVKSMMKKHDSIRYYFQEDKGYRVAKARNLGGKYALGNIIIFLNDDIIALPNLLKNYVKANRNFDVVLGYTASYFVEDAYNIEEIRKIVDTDISRLKDMRIISDFRDNQFNDNKLNVSKSFRGIWKIFVATNFSIKKSLFKKEWFNESFVGWGAEDEEYGYRLVNEGYTIKMDKDCIGLHMPHKNERMIDIYTDKKVSALMKNLLKLFYLFPNNEIEGYIKKRYGNLPEEFKDRSREIDFYEKIGAIKKDRFKNKMSNKSFLDSSKNKKLENYIDKKWLLNMKLIKKTKSRCPQCLKIIDASVFEKEDGVWMYKECEEHGKFKGFIERDIDYYKTMMNDKGEVSPIGCVIVPITHRCNLRCKFCFVPKRGIKEKTTEELKNEIRNIINKTNTPVIVLSGGEPTLREDLFKLIEFLKNEHPSQYLCLLTNGLKLADSNYAEKIKASGLDVVTFSLNGFDDEVYQKLNNEKLLDIKLKALKNLKRNKILTIISPTIFRGINEKELKPIINYAMNNLDFVCEVRIRGGAKVGRHDKINPLMASELFSLLADALNKDKKYFLSKFSKKDCYHSINQFLIKLLIDNNKNKKEILDFTYEDGEKETISDEIKIKNITSKILPKRDIEKIFQAIAETKIRFPIKDHRVRYYRWYLFFKKLDIETLRINMWWWPDKTNIDLEEIRAMGVMHATNDGRILPFYEAILRADEL